MENRMFDLHGMTALVTGASGGIGSSIARALARQGARLAVSGSNATKLRAFRDERGDDGRYRSSGQLDVIVYHSSRR
jgi:NAD(P)-dependent dehydrogenase (short-subunit alcohol dehydrogenase family)